MARKSSNDPLFWVVMLIIGFPVAVFLLLKLCVKGIAVLAGTISGSTNIKKETGHKRSSTYSKPGTTRSTSTSRSTDFLSSPRISGSTTKTQSTYSATNTTYAQVPAQTTKQISLYEALRLPGDPDPEFGGCSIYINPNEKFVPSHKEEVVEFDFDDEFIDEVEDIEEEFDEVEEIDETDVALGAFALYGLLSDRHEDEDYDKKDGYEDDEDYSWETHCEYCGELLEDCVCDHRHESHEAISLWDCDCDDDDDDDDNGWGSSRDDDDDRDGLCDFDEFSSF